MCESNSIETIGANKQKNVVRVVSIRAFGLLTYRSRHASMEEQKKKTMSSPFRHGRWSKQASTQQHRNNTELSII